MLTDLLNIVYKNTIENYFTLSQLYRYSETNREAALLFTPSNKNQTRK